MPLSPHGERQLKRLEREYDPETAKRVLYASENAKKPGFTNIHPKGYKKKRRRRRR